MGDFPLISLIWVPLAGAPATYLAGRLARLWIPSQPLVARWAALCVLAVSWGCWGQAWQSFDLNGSQQFLIGTVALQLDGITLLVATLVLLLTTLVTLFSLSYMAGETGESKYYALLLALAGVMIGLASASDLFNLWVWFEAMAVTSYLLVAFYRKQPASLEAGVKYLVQSATGSVLVLMGVALVLGQTGTLDLNQIRILVTNAQGQPLALQAAVALFMVGFGVKAAFVPLHTWLPDAHAQAPSGISAMLSGVVIEVGLIALLRVTGALSGVSPVLGSLLLGFAALNLLVGNLLALPQTQLKRMLAFSSISHVGYMLLGFGITLHGGQMAGGQGSLFHLLSHGLMKGLAFLAVGALMYGVQPHPTPLTITDLAGASKKYPFVALALTLALLGLGGLPPLVGFMSKWQILAAGFATQNVVVMGLVLFAAFNSILSLAYYVPLVNVLYRQQPSPAILAGQPLPIVMIVSLFVPATAILVIGIYPNLVRWLVEPAAATLLTLFNP